VAVAAVTAALATGAGLWWRGRPERHLAEAARLVAAGDPAAVSWLDVPEASRPTRDRALLLRAQDAVQRGRPRQAVAPLERVDPAGPCAADAAFWKGRTLYAAGQTLKAIGWFRRSLALRPDDATTLRWLAAAAYDQGDSPAAVDALARVTRLNPSDARAWRALAVLHKEDLEYERAGPAYAEALRLDPGQPAVRLELAEVLMAQGRFADAERELAACRGGVPEGDRLDLLARCLRVRLDRDQLGAMLDAALAADPGHPGLLAQRALVDQSEGRPAEAVARLDRALTADPYNAQWTYQRGRALHRLGRAKEAARDLARAAELNGHLAEMSDLNGRAARDPADPDVRQRIGDLCLRLGKSEMAASWYYAALACDPRHPGARAGLAALGPSRTAFASRASAARRQGPRPGAATLRTTGPVFPPRDP
jgi:tetratricopeptide (TPR) repeat protein